jgi:hypothetical protein
MFAQVVCTVVVVVAVAVAAGLEKARAREVRYRRHAGRVARMEREIYGRVMSSPPYRRPSRRRR